jgi:hypothetical protein
MSTQQKIPINREDDGELLGFVVQDGASWQAQTLFGYTLARTVTQKEAEMVVREQGLSSLMGTWQYFDEDDEQWYPCILKEANEHKVTVIRTNYMGYQDPDDYKLVTIASPDETKLAKA